MCFLAGANSIFDGDKLLTTPNTKRSADLEVSCVLLRSSGVQHAQVPTAASRLPCTSCGCTESCKWHSLWMAQGKLHSQLA